MKKTLLFLASFLCSCVAVAQISISATVDKSITCAGSCDGSIRVTVVSGGVAPYSYQFSPGMMSGIISFAGGSAVVSNLCSAAYTVTVSDANSVTATSSVVLTMPPSLNAYSSVRGTGCMVDTLVTEVLGGTPPYNILWSNGFSQTLTPPDVSFIAVTSSNIYTTTVTDANGCTASSSVFVNRLPPVSTSVTTSSGCGGATLTGIATGGTGTYLYSWSPTNGLSNPGSATTQASVSGTYTFTATDNSGCSSSSTINVTIFPSMSLSTSSSDASCGQSNGSASVSVSAGGGSYTYSWSNGQSTPSISNLAAGAYTVTVTDNNGCTASASAIVNNVSGPVSTIFSRANPHCKGSSSGFISAGASGGTPPYSYAWNTFATTAQVNGLPGGTYTLTVTDANGCKHVQQVTLVDPGSLFVQTSATPANCTSNGSAKAGGFGGNPPYLYRWSTSPAQNTPTATGLSAGPYAVTVTDANGCTGTGSVQVSYYCLNVVEGHLFRDLNADCIKDPGEDGFVQKTIVATGSQGRRYIAYTDVSGFYSLKLDTGSYTLSVATPPAYYQASCPAVPGNTYTVSFTNHGNTLTGKNFAGSLPPNVQDMRIMHRAGVARPGFRQLNYVDIHNDGTVPVSGTLEVTYDNALTYTGNANPPSASATGGTIVWNYGNIQPGSSQRYMYELNVPTLNNGGFIGRRLDYLATVNPLSGDTTAYNNNMQDSIRIRGAYDPNMKEVAPQGKGAGGDIVKADSVMLYTIHFQNTGTDTAFTVVLLDTLSSFLNTASIEPVISSHASSMELLEDSILRFTFRQILLVDSFTNEPGSHGFVSFRIRQRSSNPLGTVIRNKAAIYFDFNPPIITNTTVNTLVKPLSILHADSESTFTIFPNPFSGSATAVYPLQGHAASLYIYDIRGMLVKTLHPEPGQNEIRISAEGLGNGMYFCTLEEGGRVLAKKKIAVIR